MDPSAAAATINAADRSTVFNARATSEGESAVRQGNQAVSDQRAMLARNWSTNDMDPDGPRPPVSNNSDAANPRGNRGVAVARPVDNVDEALLQSWPHMAQPLGPRQTSFVNPRNPPGVSSGMHDAARLVDWERVLEISAKNPEAATFIGHGGFTALHHLCSRRCPRADVAEAVIRANPEALVMEETSKGWTPLHFACRFKCNRDVVSKLLNLYPEKGRQAVSKLDRQRRPPLWYAVRYLAPAGVIPQLLEVDPSVVLADNQESPLVEIWDKYAEKMEGRRALHPFIGEPSDNTDTPTALRDKLQQTPELFDNWKRANMFLKAAFGFPLSENNELADTDRRRWRILHVTAAVKCHPTLFQMAKALYPEQASELDDNDLYAALEEATTGVAQSRRQTALHLAASSNTTGPNGRAVITDLLRLYPEAARMPDEIDGSYPLHRIAENKHKQHWTFDGINPLFMANPAAVEQPDRNGKLPLHRAAAAIAGRLQEAEDNNNEDQNAAADIGTRSIICNLLHVFPQAATCLDNDGCTPFHIIAMNCGDWTAEVQAVYAANERAISTRTGRGLNNALPIHLAAANPKASRSCIERFVQLNPRGLSQADARGKLPLHLACEQGKDWQEGGVEAIHNAFPQAVRTPEENDRHWMALHMASASSNACGSLIQKLVELYPEACSVRDSKGRLPFHLACESGKTWDQGLSVLFDGHPGAIASIDNEGRLPLYIVAERHASAAIGRESRDKRDADDVEKEARETVELDVLYNLVRSDPTTIPEAD